MPNADDLYMDGLDLFAAGDFAGAVRLFEEVVELDSTYVDAFHGIARACFESREADPSNLDKAIAAAKRVVELDPDDITAYSTLSQCYVWKDDKATAEFWGNKARVAGWKDQLRDEKRKPKGSDAGSERDLN